MIYYYTERLTLYSVCIVVRTGHSACIMYTYSRMHTNCSFTAVRGGPVGIEQPSYFFFSKKPFTHRTLSVKHRSSRGEVFREGKKTRPAGAYLQYNGPTDRLYVYLIEARVTTIHYNNNNNNMSPRRPV